MTPDLKDFRVLLSPCSAVLVIVDHQDDFLSSLSSSTRETLADNTDALASVAKVCDVSVVLSTLVSDTFRGRTWPRLLELFTEPARLQRGRINCWEDPAFVARIEAFGKRRLLVAGLWTETAVSFAALSALELGYDVFLVTDACAGMSAVSHETAIQRMVQAGVVPITWRQILFEWYGTISDKEQAIGEALIEIAKEHGYLLNHESSQDAVKEIGRLPGVAAGHRAIVNRARRRGLGLRASIPGAPPALRSGIRSPPSRAAESFVDLSRWRGVGGAPF